MDFITAPSSGNADILLINPDFSKNELGTASMPENHLGLNRIASYLTHKGKTCHVLDTTGRAASTNGPEELGNWIAENAERYDSLGFHVNSWNINHILRALDKARLSLNGKKVLFGGPLASSEPKKLAELFIKKGLKRFGVVQGMGEKVTDEILSRERLSEADGLWAYEDGAFQEGSKLALDKDEFENLPFLGLEHNTFYQKYYKPMLERGDIGGSSLEMIFGSQGLEVNRGCPFNCTYCSVPQYEEKLIQYSPKRVADELEYLAEEAGFFMFTFTNSNILAIEPEWIRTFCREIIGRGMDNYLNWTAYHHPSILARMEQADYNLMRKAGCDTIVFGIQSFEDSILKLFLRPPDTKRLTDEIIRKAKQAKQEVAVDYITGIPGEDLSVIREAFRYFADNDIECRNYQLKFYPNTKLPLMGLDLSGHDLIPITGDLAPELEAYAVVSKTPCKESAELDSFIRKSNDRIVRKRPPRFGKYIADTPEKARHMMEYEIPDNPEIPDKVKKAMTIALREMLRPDSKLPADNMDPMEIMKAVIMAGPDAPPMLLAMRERMKKEMGEEKFNKLLQDYLPS